jgi:tetratricopeptide (TPR) repeat protein
MAMKTLIVLVLWSSLSWGADIQVTLTVDQVRISEEDSIQAQIAVTGVMSAPQPEITNAKDFDIQSFGTSTQFNMINGAISRSVNFSYQFTPKRAGRFTVGPAKVVVGGKTYESNAVLIDVAKSGGGGVAGGGNPPGSAAAPDSGDSNGVSKLFQVKADVDPRRLYVNQQGVFTFQFLARAQLQNAQLSLPNFSGFIKEELEKEKQMEKVMNGIPWQVNEMKFSLYPIAPGKVDLGETSVQGDVLMRSRGRGNSPFDSFFDDFGMGMGGRPKHLRVKSEPVTVDILPLPDTGKPATFGGLVGNFKIKSTLSRTSLAVGDSVTQTLEISGDGNLRDITFPELGLKEFKTYDDKPALKTWMENGRLVGTKTLKRALVPLAAGAFRLPAARLDYFDPVARAYKVAEAAPLELTVSGGTGGSEKAEYAGSGPAPSTKKEVAVQGEDIMPIKRTPGSWRSSPLEGTRAFVLWLLLGLAPVVYVVTWFTSRAYRKRRADTVSARKRKAYRALQARLAQMESKKPGQYSQVFREYLGDKFNFDGLASTSDDVKARLSKVDLSESLVARATRFLAHCEQGEYGGAMAPSPESLGTDLVQIVEEIEKSAPARGSKGRVSVAWAVAVGLAWASASARAGLFDDGVKAYESGDYENAVKQFTEVLKNESGTGELHYNLGNAYFRTKHLGQAVLNYRRAWELLPRDPDVHFNLTYAQKNVVDATGTSLGNDWMLTFLPLSLVEILALGVGLTSLLLTVAMLYLFQKKVWLEWAQRGLIVIWLVWAGLAAIRWVGQSPMGAVTAEDAEVYSGFGKGNAVLFHLHEGTLFERGDLTDGWVQIRLSDGKKGWMRLQDVAL